MCRLTLFFFLLAANFRSEAQIIIGKMYTIVPDYVKVYGLDAAGSKTVRSWRASKNTKFTVTGYDKDHNIKLTFWRYRDTAKKPEDFQKAKSLTEIYNFTDASGYIGKWANYKEFVMAPEDFTSACIPYYGVDNDFTWGVMTLPYKLRLGNSGDRYFSYQEMLNLGFVFGLRHQLSGRVQHSINYLIGIGTASVIVDELSLASGVVAPTNNNSTAFSSSIGALYAYGNFQVGLFTGVDIIPGSIGKSWKYQGRPSIGLAIGVSLFSKTGDGGAAGTNTVKHDAD